MSTSEIQPNEPQNSVKKTSTTLSWIVIILLAVVFSSYLIYDTITHKEKKSLITNNTNTEISSIPLPPEPAEMFSYSGNITKIEDKNIFIIANVQKGNSYIAKEIKVITDENTDFLLQDLSRIPIPLPPGQEGPSYEPAKINLSNLKVGEYITVSADENIKGKEEFIASSVTVSFNSLED